MRRLAAGALVLLAACSQQTQQETPVDGQENEAQPAQGPPNPPAAGEPHGLREDRTSISEGPIDPKSAQGAGQVLQTYFALIEAGRKEEADELWWAGGSKTAFDARLAQYRETHASIGAPGEPQGAAGSIYVDIPAELYGRLKNGKEFNVRGTMTLRRVNEVPGSTAEQRAWHIYESDFPQMSSAR